MAVRFTFFLFLLAFLSAPVVAQEVIDQKTLPCAVAGYLVCQLELGKAYAAGDGVQQDFDQALYWLKKAIRPENGTNLTALMLIDAIEKYKNGGGSVALHEIEKLHRELKVGSDGKEAQNKVDIGSPPLNDEETKRQKLQEFQDLDIDVLLDVGSESPKFKRRNFDDIMSDVFKVGMAGLLAGAIFVLPGALYLLWRERRSLRLSLTSAMNFLAEMTKSIIFRVAVSLYLGWVCTVVLTNNFEFYAVLDFEYFDSSRSLFLLTVPPFVALVGASLINWCRKAHDE